jgi:hypothetical protein
MPRAKRSIESTVTIDGISLVWYLHREQQLCTDDGWKGMSIHVRNVEGARRELHMEYPLLQTQKSAYARIVPVRPGIVAAKVEAHIREAMADGWDPESRGKPYVVHLAELPS